MPLLLDQLCECGHSRAAHYGTEQRPGACMEPKCCTQYVAKGPAQAVVDRPSPPVKVELDE